MSQFQKSLQPPERLVFPSDRERFRNIPLGVCPSIYPAMRKNLRFRIVPKLLLQSAQMTRKKILLLFFIAAATAILAAPPKSEAEIAPRVAKSLEELSQKPRPRLLLGPDGVEGLRRNAKTNLGKPVAECILNDANLLLNEPVLRYELRPDLLRVARAALFRIATLANAYMLTGNRAFADRGIQEMQTVCDFPDWYSQHFLGVAELGLAVSLGYDFFYRELTAEQREKMVETLYTRLILPSMAEPVKGRWSWVGADNNWNQVCHTGTVAAAIAIYERDPALMTQAVSRALADIQPAMLKSYAPDGTYAEGPMYWGYGTDYNCILFQLLQAAFGTCFDLEKLPGFDRTAEYMMQVTTPLGTVYPYSDCQAHRALSLAPFWMGMNFDRPDYICNQDRRQLAAQAANRTRLSMNRLLPFALFSLDRDAPPPKDAPLRYFAAPEAAVPLAIFRTGYGPLDAYGAIKAGPANGPHGHMDAGSFFYLRDGVIWADELQHERYEIFKDRADLNFWNGSQDGARFDLFRQGPRSHNILMLNDAKQRVSVKAELRKVSDDEVEVDLGEIYADFAGSVVRSAAFGKDGSLAISDRMTGLKPGTRVRFQFCTGTAAEVGADGQSVTLRSGEKRLRVVRSDTAGAGAWQVVECDRIPRKFDNETPAPGYRMIEFEAVAPADGKLAFKVEFQPLPPCKPDPAKVAANFFIFNPPKAEFRAAADPADGAVTVTLPATAAKLPYYSVGCNFATPADLSRVKRVRFLAKSNLPVPVMFGLIAPGGRLTAAADRAIRLKPDEYTAFELALENGERTGAPDLAATRQFFVGLFSSLGDTTASDNVLTLKDVEFVE